MDKKLQSLRRLKLRDGGGVVVEKRSSSGVVDESRHLPQFPSPQLISYRKRRKENRSGSESEKAMSEEEKRITRSRTIINVNNNNNNNNNRERREKKMNEHGLGRRVVITVSLSSKEKEEDFMKLKGGCKCKPSQRPNKRAKSIQRSILLLSPGAWLWDVCPERYQVREEKKKTFKKKPSGLKAMEMDSN